MSTDKRLETLYAQYQDVVANRRVQIRYRSRYLFLILAVIVLILVQGLYPKLVLDLLIGVVARFSGAKPPENFPILEPILLFVYMLVVLRYLQISVGIERSYDDTNHLETQLRCKFGVSIKTEGDGYENEYPAILNWFDGLYKLVIPIGMLLIAVLPIVQKLPTVFKSAILLDVLTLAFAVVVIVFVSLFLWFCYSGTIQQGLDKIGLRRNTATEVSDDSKSPNGQ